MHSYRFNMREKGVSPLVATVLLIAFTVAVAGVVSTWLTGFTTTSTTTIGETATTELICSYGHVAVSDLIYCSNRIAGVITNTGSITLGNITLQELFTNQTTSTFYLCKSGNSVVTCSGASNLTLGARESTAFNITIGNSNYGTLRVITNCSSTFAEAKQADHAAC